MSTKLNKRQRSVARDRRARAVREAAISAIPTNWVDPLLTGPDGIGSPPYGCPAIERLLNAVKQRVMDATAVALSGSLPEQSRAADVIIADFRIRAALEAENAALREDRVRLERWEEWHSRVWQLVSVHGGNPERHWHYATCDYVEPPATLWWRAATMREAIDKALAAIDAAKEET